MTTFIEKQYNNIKNIINKKSVSKRETNNACALIINDIIFIDLADDFSIIINKDGTWEIAATDGA